MQAIEQAMKAHNVTLISRQYTDECKQIGRKQVRGKREVNRKETGRLPERKSNRKFDQGRKPNRELLFEKGPGLQ